MWIRRLTFAAILALLLFVPANASAATSGDWQYTTQGGKAVITKYTGSETVVTTPEELGGYPVSEIG